MASCILTIHHGKANLRVLLRIGPFNNVRLCLGRGLSSCMKPYAGASVGRHCIINTKALIEHDTFIEDHCHIATVAVENGGAKVQCCSFIGSNTVLREHVVVGEKSIVGAGVTVLHSVAPRLSMRLQFS